MALRLGASSSRCIEVCRDARAGRSYRVRVCGVRASVAPSLSRHGGSRVKGQFLAEDVGPNALVLEAQGRVCTGPRQTRPLDEDQAFKVLRTIVQSAEKELPENERVSAAQMGAFFAAMTIRASSFPPPTQWSEGERKALHEYWPRLVHVLPADVLFVADPDGSLVDGIQHAGTAFVGKTPVERRLVGVLREVLRGDHLGFEEIVGLLRDMLPLQGDGKVSDALVAAFLIALRMNGETDRELKACCMAFDDELAQANFQQQTLPPSRITEIRTMGTQDFSAPRSSWLLYGRAMASAAYCMGLM